MIHTINVEENLLTEEECLITYIIVLKSYRTIFDEYDGHLVSGLASLTYELYRRFTHLWLFKKRQMLNLRKKLSKIKERGDNDVFT